MRPTPSLSLALVAALSACDAKTPAAGAEAAPSASATAEGAVSATVSASAAAAPKFPPEARRNSAPVGIGESALAVGQPAPKLENIPATTGAWSRGDKLTVLVFYRGHW